MKVPSATTVAVAVLLMTQCGCGANSQLIARLGFFVRIFRVYVAKMTKSNPYYYYDPGIIKDVDPILLNADIIHFKAAPMML